jgi:aminoglycoside phosphotransferase family enzyme
VHGDFHPWNILFRTGNDFTVLDRSRGEWGESTDDVTCLTINYLFSSLQRHGRLAGPFATLFGRFWQRYLEQTKDHEMLAVAAPFFAFRALVLANPLWYPNLAEPLRRKLFAFIRRLLDAETFDPHRVNEYCEA